MAAADLLECEALQQRRRFLIAAHRALAGAAQFVEMRVERAALLSEARPLTLQLLPRPAQPLRAVGDKLEIGGANVATKAVATQALGGRKCTRWQTRL